MITEAARQSQENKANEDLKKNLQEIVKAAAVYERLESSSDFAIVLEHLKGLAQLHDEQIKGYLSLLPGASFFKRMKIVEVMLVHQIRKEQIEEAMNYPKRIVFDATKAREVLQTLREKEKEHATD